MNILLYMLKRMIYNIPVILLLTVFVFAMVRFLPGDPADILLSGEGGAEDPIVRATLMKELGLDKPIPVQYGIWLWRAAHGNFGKSVYSQEEVYTLIMDRFPATLMLALSSISFDHGGPAGGIISAVKRQKPADYAAMIFACWHFHPGILVRDHAHPDLLSVVSHTALHGLHEPLRGFFRVPEILDPAGDRLGFTHGRAW